MDVLTLGKRVWERKRAVANHSWHSHAFFRIWGCNSILSCKIGHRVRFIIPVFRGFYIFRLKRLRPRRDSNPFMHYIQALVTACFPPPEVARSSRMNSNPIDCLTNMEIGQYNSSHRKWDRQNVTWPINLFEIFWWNGTVIRLVVWTADCVKSMGKMSPIMHSTHKSSWDTWETKCEAGWMGTVTQCSWEELTWWGAFDWSSRADPVIRPQVQTLAAMPDVHWWWRLQEEWNSSLVLS